MYDLQMVPVLNQLSDTDVFFQDMKEVESLVKDSLLVYTAYDLKAQDAAAYLADTKLVFPLLKKEAELRGMKLPELAALIVKKAEVFKDTVKKAELLRTEFNILYPKTTTFEEKMQLRDRLLTEFKSIMGALKA